MERSNEDAKLRLQSASCMWISAVGRGVEAVDPDILRRQIGIFAALKKMSSGRFVSDLCDAEGQEV